MNSTRTVSESEYYNNSKLKRKGIDSLVDYCYYYSNRSVSKEVKKVFSCYEKKNKLEIGAKSWYEWIYLNDLRIKKLTCINISSEELKLGEKMSLFTKSKINFLIADAHKLPFEKHSFSVVYGSSILHHLNISEAIEQIKKVLAKDGEIVFEEPLNINPLYKIYRYFTPWQRTKFEKAFTLKELNLLKENFNVKFYYYNFLTIPFGMFAKLIYSNKSNPISEFASKLDTKILRLPILGKLASKVLIVGKLHN